MFLRGDCGITDGLLTAAYLKRNGWTKRSAEPDVYRLDMPETPLKWLLLTESVMGWSAEYVHGGLHERYGSIVTIGELERFVALKLAGRN